MAIAIDRDLADVKCMEDDLSGWISTLSGKGGGLDVHVSHRQVDLV